MDLRRAVTATAVVALMTAGCGGQDGGGAATQGSAAAPAGGAATGSGRDATTPPTGRTTPPVTIEVKLRAAAFPVPAGWHVIDDTTRQEPLASPQNRVSVRRVVLAPGGATASQLRRAQRAGDRWIVVEEWDDARGVLDAALRRRFPRSAEPLDAADEPTRLDGRAAVRWTAASRPPESGAIPYAEAGVRAKAWTSSFYCRFRGRDVGVDASPRLEAAIDAIREGWRWNEPRR